MHRHAPNPSTLGLIAALLIGCGGDDTTGPTPPPDPARPTSITVTPASTELTALGETVQLSAEVRDQNGRTMSGAAVAWASSAPSVASVDGSGLVTAASNGTATITARAGSASGSAGISVEQAVAAVRVAPETVILEVGDTVRLEATALDARDNVVPGVEFDWSSSHPSVATVDPAGLVRAAGVGAATVTAASGAWQGSSTAAVLSNNPWITTPCSPRGCRNTRSRTPPWAGRKATQGLSAHCDWASTPTRSPRSPMRATWVSR